MDSSPHAKRCGTLFSEDFDLPETAPAPKVVEPVYSAGELMAARESAWRDGHEAGLSEAAAADTAATKETMAQIAAQLRAESEAALMQAEQQAESVARLLLASLAATFPALSARYGDGEARAIARIVLPALAQEPMITIRAHSQTTAAISREIGKLDPEFRARVETMTSDAIPPGDVRITWRNGSAIRSVETLWRQVADVLIPAGLLRTDARVKEMVDGD
jgi:flagellar biosynthesis/type III secretory pathway protein FliH